MSAGTVLLAAKRLHPDATSEGICTARTLEAMVGAGLTVAVVTSDEATDAAGLRRALPWFDGPLVHVRTLPRRPTAGAGRRLWAGIDLAGTWVDGHPTWYRRSVGAWREALTTAIGRHRPSVVVTRGAGGGFEPHLAVARLGLDVPWVAHYHDPWPAGRWPEPYRPAPTRALARQDRGHEAILRQADALTFPSARLRDWIVGDDPGRRARSHVVPHVLGPATPPPGADPALVAAALDRPFTLVHTGTLLRHRRVDALLAAVAAFTGDDGERRAATRLVLAGPAAAGATTTGAAGLAAELEADGRLWRHVGRTTQATALTLAAGASATVLVEAAAPESPFFPGKLADYLGTGRPVLALSPRESVASDLMGEAHPLRVDPDDRDGITAAITTLWAAWRAGTLDALAPPAAALAPLTPAAVGTTLTTLLDDLGAGAGPASLAGNGALRPEVAHP